MAVILAGFTAVSCMSGCKKQGNIENGRNKKITMWTANSHSKLEMEKFGERI
ncbi:MAG: hypothetical protein L6V93_17940 [Clostridiales bacterium]|nr:MAG: hypothetical protein L6V93_17940 [Clostridiales bacterium]